MKKKKSEPPVIYNPPPGTWEAVIYPYPQMMPFGRFGIHLEHNKTFSALIYTTSNGPWLAYTIKGALRIEKRVNKRELREEADRKTFAKYMSNAKH